MAEVHARGWKQLDIVMISGDAYVDHPAFGPPLIARFLEGRGFKVGIIAQPDWHSTRDFEALGQPRLFFGVTGGNMDSMVNRYTSDLRVRSDDAYTPGGQGGKRLACRGSLAGGVVGACVHGGMDWVWLRWRLRVSACGRGRGRIAAA